MKLSAMFRCAVMLGLMSSAIAAASELSVPNTFSAGTPAVADEVNENFEAGATAINDNHSRLQALEMLHGEVTHVQWLSWYHAGEIAYMDFYESGVSLWFERSVLMGGLTQRNGVVLELYYLADDYSWQRYVRVDVEALQDVGVDGDGLIVDATVDTSTPAVAQGIRVRPMQDEPYPQAGVYRLVLRGDFITDENGRAVDGDFLLGETPSGDGMPGGVFESWFTVLPL